MKPDTKPVISAQVGKEEHDSIVGLVEKRKYRSKSEFVQEAVAEKLKREGAKC